MAVVYFISFVLPLINFFLAEKCSSKWTEICKRFAVDYWLQIKLHLEYFWNKHLTKKVQQKEIKFGSFVFEIHHFSYAKLKWKSRKHSTAVRCKIFEVWIVNF